MSLITLENTITIALSVKDRHRSVDWYQRVLGFEMMYHLDEAGWSEVKTKTPGVTIGFGEQADPAPGNSVPVFGVADIDAARAAMEADGIRFDGPTEEIEGMVKLATFYDPDNNALMLAQNLAAEG